MATTTELDELKINYMTQAQYNTEKAAGRLNENEIYMTPQSAVNVPTKTSDLTNDSGFITASDSSITGKQTKPVKYSASITTGSWTSASNRVTKNFTVTGIAASYNVPPIIDIDMSSVTDGATMKTQLEQWAKVLRITTQANQITVYATEAITTNFTMSILVFPN